MAFLSPHLGRRKAAIFAFLVSAIAAVQAGLGYSIYTGYVDYPLGITMLASLANLQQAIAGGRRSTWAFALLFAAIAALLKSEGLTFLLAVTLVAIFKARRVLLSRQVLPPFLVAAALVLAWQIFAAIHGWRSHHLLNESVSSLPFVVPARAFLIAAFTVEALVSHPDYIWLVAAFLLTAWLALRHARGRAGATLLVLTLQGVVYYGVFILNPGELTGTFHRLVIQLAPPLVLLLGLAISSDSGEPEVSSEVSHETGLPVTA